MTDERLRAAQRRAGAFEADVAALAERLRAGRIGLDRVEIAAFCGDEVARAALGSAAPAVPQEQAAWVRGLEAWSSETALRGFLTAAALDVGMSLDCVDRLVARAVRGGRGSTQAFADERDRLGAAHAKLISLATHTIEQDPRFVPVDDPEVVRATEDMAARYAHDRVKYGRTVFGAYRGQPSWLHQFVVVAPRQERWPVLCGAEPGWVPPAGTERFPIGSRGVFGDFIQTYLDVSIAAHAEARRRLAAWALM